MMGCCGQGSAPLCHLGLSLDGFRFVEIHGFRVVVVLPSFGEGEIYILI